MSLSTWVTGADAAYYCGRPIGTIWRWASEGRIRRSGVGRGARYWLPDLPHGLRDEATRELIQPGAAPALPNGVKAA
ncbi:DNA-binding protein [Streptomyces sp. NPDC088925]|uniref:DNA-binding protein n=1 Tax=Streptomyces sp. NPDC088925 TaxID=3365914 RepID=UPI0037F5C552